MNKVVKIPRIRGAKYIQSVVCTSCAQKRAARLRGSKTKSQ